MAVSAAAERLLSLDETL